MFLEQDIIEFVNKIINQNNQNKEEIKTNIEKFQEYLKLTKMADDTTLQNFEQIINCLDEIMNLKEKLGTFDITTLKVGEEKQEKEVKVKEKKKEAKPYIEKHYHHYETYTPSYPISSSCGGSTNSYRSSC